MLHSVIVGPVASTARGLSSEVDLTEGDGVRRPSVVNLDNLQLAPANDCCDALAERLRERRARSARPSRRDGLLCAQTEEGPRDGTGPSAMSSTRLTRAHPLRETEG
ncbi:MAG: hypothetical protein ACRDV8_06485 [Acidimicrobiales bacterium]